MNVRVFALSVLAGVSAASGSTVVFENINDNGFFTPFNSGTPSNVRYGDSGWLTGDGSGVPMGLEQITLGLAAYNPSQGNIGAGTFDLTFTFNNGDPSGLVFGPGTTLYSTTITGVSLPALSAEGLGLFSLSIPLPGVVTSGGFNNVGWSVGVSNFSYAGQFGFQASSALGQTTGFYTNNASVFNGTFWNIFSFGGDPITGVANYVATITVPSPAGAAALGLGGLLAIRRRRA
jgi:hypothetical protein